MDKSTMDDIVVPTVLKLIGRKFPAMLRAIEAGRIQCAPVSESDRDEIAREIDVALWIDGEKPLLAGRRVSSPVTLRPESAEAETWAALIGDRLNSGSGLSVIGVGERLSEPGAERAELTNLAARHVHTLRGRLRDGDAIVTANHAYQIAGDLSVALVS
jgi:hypothetical protein